MQKGSLLVRLPDGQTLIVPDLSTTLVRVLDRCRAWLGDQEITAKKYGTQKHCFFASRNTFVDGDLLLTAPLSQLGIEPGDELELRYGAEAS